MNDGELERQVIALIDKQTTAVTLEGKAYPRISRETLTHDWLSLIAAQTDAAQRELLERLKRYKHTYTITEVDGIDYTDGYGSHITAVTETAIDAELQHLKSQESGKGED